ncbi:hypothetical protein [Paenibacillus daejeonensis]|uniref:hypothetical protein n=1 Tax=Paenibacillus daejeonensis TaxID=135193 RepID=UPI0003774E1A|nr:hypothetical protein [Paenibacillus daejeonensis]
MAALTVLYLKRKRLGLNYEETLVLADEMLRVVLDYQRIEEEVILEDDKSLVNKGGRRALGQLSVQQLLDILESAQQVNVDQPFLDELFKELRRKLTQQKYSNY